MSIGRTYDTVGVLRVGLTLNQWYHAIQYQFGIMFIEEIVSYRIIAPDLCLVT